MQSADLLRLARLLCWRIARIATGRLRAHPYLRYQRDPSPRESLAYALYAVWHGDVLARTGRPLHIFSIAMDNLARELADARALTLSGDLSDNLGRAQTMVRELKRELAAALADGPSAPRPPIVHRGDGSMAATNWPYLAL